MNQTLPEAQLQYVAGPNVRTNPAVPTKSSLVYSLDSAPVIKDVWEENFDEEFRKIMRLAENYRIIAMDTEFPGIVYRVNDNEVLFNENIEYKVVKKNVDQLKCIQVGLSLCTEEGQTPAGGSTWQFNLKFDKNVDECSQESLELLESSGLQFDKHATNGVNSQLFAEYLIASGLLLNENVTWVCFHGSFDFAYLLKMLVVSPLPNEDTGFYNLLNTYFPVYYDMKYMIRDLDNIKVGGLSKLATDLSIKRFGPQHQAGSDALLTLACFIKLRDNYFKSSIDARYRNVIFGIGNNLEALSDYLPSYINYTDYGQIIYSGYPMNSINPNLVNSFYNQPDTMYPPAMSGNNYGFSYNVVYNNYSQPGFVDVNNRTKKFEGYSSANKNDVRK